MDWKWSPAFLAPGAKKPRGWVIFTPRIRRAKPLLAGLIVLEPSEAGKCAAVLPGWTVDRSSLFGRFPVLMRIVGMRRVRRTRKEMKNARRVVRRVERRWNVRPPMIIHVVVRKFEEMTGFSMNFMREEGAERRAFIFAC